MAGYGTCARQAILSQRFEQKAKLGRFGWAAARWRVGAIVFKRGALPVT
jgi:hypothetical protein